MNVVSLPLGLTACGRHMIQPADENKYRFDMLVSARAMGLAWFGYNTAGGGKGRRHRQTLRRYKLEELGYRACENRGTMDDITRG